MILKGKKVVLRAIEEEDLDMLRELSNDPDFEKMVIGWSFPISKKDEAEWFANLKAIAEECGFAANVKDYKKNKEAYKGHIGDVAEIIRIAVTTRKQTPNLYYILKILGQGEYERRITLVMEK